MPWALLKVIDMGYVAVEFFFVLSGFILAYSYLGRARTVSAREFWIARFARIYPVYGLALLIATPELIEQGRLLWGFGRTGAALHAVAALGMVQAWYPPNALYYDGPSWSLSVEAFFYALFPFLLPALVRLPKSRLFSALAIVALLGSLLPLAAGFLISRSASVHEPLQDWPKFFPPMHLPAFLFGALLGRVFLERSEIVPADWKLALLGWGAALAMLVGAFVPGLFLFKHSGGLILLHGAMVWALAHGRGTSARVLSWPLPVLLGEASYGLYIIHAPMFYWWNRAFLRLGFKLTTYDRFGRVAFLMAIVALAIFIYKRFELPSREWIRARFTHLGARPVA